MSVKPIDMKTNLMANNDASRIRETQKAAEAGQGANVAQHKDRDVQKHETIQKTQETEYKKVRREDEESDKKHQNNATPESSATEAEKHKEPEKKQHPQLSDGLRGLQIDFKA